MNILQTIRSKLVSLRRRQIAKKIGDMYGKVIYTVLTATINTIQKMDKNKTQAMLDDAKKIIDDITLFAANHAEHIQSVAVKLGEEMQKGDKEIQKAVEDITSTIQRTFKKARKS